MTVVKPLTQDTATGRGPRGSARGTMIRAVGDLPRGGSRNRWTIDAVTLLYLLIGLLAGRFSLSRLSASGSESDAALDLRWLILGGAILLTGTWAAVNAERGALLRPVGSILVVLPMLVWSGWLIITGFWAPEGARVGEARWDMFFMGWFITLTWIVVSRSSLSGLERVWPWMLAIGLIYLFAALAAGPGDQGRFSAPGGGPNTFVRIMIVGGIAAFYLAVVKGRTVVLSVVPVFVLGAVLSGSRGGLLAAALVSLLFGVPLLRLLGWRKALGLAACGFAVLPLVLTWNDGYLVEFVRDRFVEQTLESEYASGRDVIAGQALAQFERQPWVGNGIDSYYALQSGAALIYEHPHNLVLATLAEGGVIGVSLLIAALLTPILTVIWYGRRSPAAMCALMAGIYFFFTGLFSGNYYDSRFVWFFLALGAATALRTREAAGTRA